MVTLREVLRKQSELTARTTRLNYKVKKLKEEEDALVRRELLNIEEVERDKAAQPLNPDDLIFNVSSEQFDLPADLD